ncbi:MAG: hypothetical protein AB2L09_02585 [Coriobacteriia bacterium]
MLGYQRNRVNSRAPNGITSSIHLNVIGQAAAYPMYVEVVTSDGHAYGDERITFSKLDVEFVQLYARVIDSDGNTVSNALGASDYNPSAKVFSTLTWSISNTEIGYINSQTGLFIPRGYGTLKAYATVTGGDPSVNNGRVTGFVWIVIDSGNYATEYNPTDSLTIRVAYESDEQYTAKEITYSVAQLRAMQSAYSTYTLTKDDGAYVTSSARGIYLTTLLDDLGIATEDVYAFRFSARDGVNPGLITANFLFRPRYYLPNIEFGGNTSGAKLVFPMLAFESDWRESNKGSTNSNEDYSALNNGTCLRLLFGSVGKADSSTSKSLKYTNKMTILLAGAPPASPDPNPGGSGGGDGGDGPDGGGGGGGDLGGGSGAAGEGVGAGTGDAAGAGTGAATSIVSAKKSAGEKTGKTGTGEGNGSGTNTGDGSGNGLEVYQMLSNAKTNLDLIDYSNPLKPFMPSVIVFCFLFGGLYQTVGFRRQLGRNPIPVSVEEKALS